MSKKIESFKKHKSQWQVWGKPPNKQGDYLERLIKAYTKRFKEYGNKCGVELAEAFFRKTRFTQAYDLLPVRQ